MSRQENWTLTCMTSLSLFKWHGFIYAFNVICAIPCLICHFSFHLGNICFTAQSIRFALTWCTVAPSPGVPAEVQCYNTKLCEDGCLYLGFLEVSSFQSNHREQIGIRGQPSKAHLFQIRRREFDIKPRAKTSKYVLKLFFSGYVQCIRDLFLWCFCQQRVDPGLEGMSVLGQGGRT